MTAATRTPAPAATDAPAPIAARTEAPVDGIPASGAPVAEAELLVEDVSIDGMCGVY